MVVVSLVKQSFCIILFKMEFVVSSRLGTPKQNGVSERKHRHIVELGLSMMYQASIPFRYWVEAFTYHSQFLN